MNVSHTVKKSSYSPFTETYLRHTHHIAICMFLVSSQLQMALTKCLLDEVLQSVSHVGGTRRRILHSGHDLLLDGVDHKQQPVYRKT